MENREIIVVTHGHWGEALIESSEMIVGHSNAIYSFPLKKGMPPEEYLTTIENHLNPDTDYLFLADLYGGTPANIAFMLKNKYADAIEIVTGVNLPIVLEAVLTVEPKTIQSLAKELADLGKEGIQVIENNH